MFVSKNNRYDTIAKKEGYYERKTKERNFIFT